MLRPRTKADNIHSTPASLRAAAEHVVAEMKALLRHVVLAAGSGPHSFHVLQIFAALALEAPLT